MPRSRNSRSASPQKSVSAESIAEIEQRKILQNVHDIFCEAIDADVIRLVLQECNWRGNRHSLWYITLMHDISLSYCIWSLESIRVRLSHLGPLQTRHRSIQAKLLIIIFIIFIEQNNVHCTYKCWFKSLIEKYQ
jgi:hypothetical protein